MGGTEILKFWFTTKVQIHPRRINSEPFCICRREWETNDTCMKFPEMRCIFLWERWLFLRSQWRDCNFSLLFPWLQLALEDPVHSVSLQQFVYEKLKAQQALMGDQGFGVLMETVDTELVRQLQEFLQGFWIPSTILHYLKYLFPMPPTPPFLKMYWKGWKSAQSVDSLLKPSHSLLMLCLKYIPTSPCPLSLANTLSLLSGSRFLFFFF